ncbi:MAG TPA: DUF3108 domain-containing protein [Bryobacteraceae bacterium]|nr:DUF3108 domain-containing protein [Bryobacteraceae bacterium]
MKSTLLLALLVAAPTHAAGPLAGFPFTDERLAYTISWPSGLGLGEAHLTSKHSAFGWNFEFNVNASVPGFEVKDSYTAHSSEDFCGVDFSRQFLHGSRKGGETETIDRSHETVSRVTLSGGGKSDFSIPDCVKDGLTFLFYARRELGQGRVPTAQRILFGGLYDIRLDYAGEQTIQVGDKPAQTDKIVGSVKGPTSAVQFEMFFARDPARTPLLVRLPLSMGKFQMELVR